MDRHEPTFEQMILADRSGGEIKGWKGRFVDYLELVKTDPSLPKLSHARVCDVILKSGTTAISSVGDSNIKRLFKDESLNIYDFFADEFFGIEKTIAKIARYFHAASLKGEESRQVLYLMGPVGSGKSSLVEKLKRGLENSDPFYAIEGCPMFEEPLHLLPRHLRREFEKMLGVKSRVICARCAGSGSRINITSIMKRFLLSQKCFQSGTEWELGLCPPWILTTRIHLCSSGVRTYRNWTFIQRGIRVCLT